MLRTIFKQSGNKTFLQVLDKQFNYQWLQQRIKKTLGFFENQGLKQGDRILLAVSDDTEMSVIFLSALVAGIGVVMADEDLKAPRAQAIVKRSDPACIIADKEALESWQLASVLPPACQVIPFVQESAAKPGLLSKFLQKNKTEAAAKDYKALLEKAPSVEPAPVESAPGTLAFIIFTSGTTSDSKGVAITHENLAAHLATLKKVYSLNANSQILNQLLLSHVDGCIQGPILAAFVGCTLHRPFRFSIEKIPALLDYCYAHNITHFFSVPAMLNMLVQFSENYEDSFSYPEFKVLVSVSANLEAPLWDSVESVFKVKVSNVYGLTETVAGSLFSGPLEDTYKKYTVGKPVDCEIRIVNEQDEDVKADEIGELLLKGPHVMKGYWGDEKTTGETIRNGWFYTGDLAAQDKEGFVTIKGRKKNLITSGGINIHPEEVTECLLSNPGISEACALGIPDEVFVEKLVAAVVLKPGSKLTAFEIVEHCRRNLDDKKVPHHIHILSDLPKGVSGKVQLKVLQERITGSQKPKPEISGEYVTEKILKVASEVFQVPVARLNIRDNSYSVDGWDSLAHLLFITDLEEKFNVRFSTAEVLTMNSIQKAVELIKQKNEPN